MADEAFNQAAEINRTLDSVEQMTLLIQAVAENARLVKEVGGEVMDNTVKKIFSLHETVA